MVSSSCWKGYERRVARLLGGSGRQPLSGAAKEIIGNEDFRADTSCIGDCKKHKSLPIMGILKWLEDVERKHKGRKKPKIIVVAKPGWRDKDSLVVLRLGKFIDILKKGGYIK